MTTWAIAEGRRRGAKRVQPTSEESRVATHRFYERLDSKRRTWASNFPSEWSMSNIWFRTRELFSELDFWPYLADLF
jgi:hypothetical protein